MDIPSASDLFEIGVSALTYSGAISEEAARTEGSTANGIVASEVAVAEAILLELIRVANARRLATASGRDLDEVAYDLTGLLRSGASPASAPIVFSRQAPATAAGTIPAGTVVAAGAVEFRTASPLVFLSGVESGVVLASATAAGPAGNVQAGTITAIRPQLFDQFTATNAEAAAGGADEEKDEPFRARAREFFALARRGTLRAIEHGAKTASGVRIAQASEVPILGPGGEVAAQWVGLVVADLSGAGGSAMVGAAAAAVDEWRAAGVRVDVMPGTPSIVRIAILCSFRPGANTTEAAARIREAVAARINSLLVEERLDPSAIVEVVRLDPDVQLVPSGSAPSVLEPAGPIVPTPGSGVVLRTSVDMITVNGQ